MTLRNEPHDGAEPGPGPRVYVRFKSSSQPKGQDGYELAVSSDATEADVDRTMLLAARAREQAQAVLAGEYTGLDDEVDANVPQELKDALSRVTPEGLARILADLRVRDAVDGAEVGYVGYV